MISNEQSLGVVTQFVFVIMDHVPFRYFSEARSQTVHRLRLRMCQMPTNNAPVTTNANRINQTL